jgi:membrane-bound ClpP family serine protease
MVTVQVAWSATLPTFSRWTREVGSERQVCMDVVTNSDSDGDEGGTNNRMVTYQARAVLTAKQKARNSEVEVQGPSQRLNTGDHPISVHLPYSEGEII